MVPGAIEAPSTCTTIFLEISRASKFPEIKDFSSNLTTGWMCLIHSWIYVGPKAHPTHTEWDKNYGVKESLLLHYVDVRLFQFDTSTNDFEVSSPEHALHDFIVNSDFYKTSLYYIRLASLYWEQIKES